MSQNSLGRYKVLFNGDLVGSFSDKTEAHLFVTQYVRHWGLDEVCISRGETDKNVYTYLFYGETRKKLFTFLVIDSNSIRIF